MSAILLVLSFPKFHFYLLAWVGLIPFFLSLEGNKTFREGFLNGYWLGILFLSATLYWFIHMAENAEIPFFLAVLATVLLILYLSLYYGIFGGLFVYFKTTKRMHKIFLVPSLWIVLEFLRDRLFSGFGWASLGYSQYRMWPLIQIADLTGVFGISFLIVMINAILAEFFKKIFIDKISLSRRDFYPLLIGGVFIILTLLYGWGKYLTYPINHPEAQRTQLKVALIQGNIKQRLKWQSSFRDLILEKYKILTVEAAQEKPDLIIWPESSFPAYLWEAPEMFEEVKHFVADLGIPLLMGVLTKERDEYYNSAMLLSGKGEIVSSYEKFHLVPFGEFIPFREQLPFLGEMIPVGDFTSGKNLSLFPVVVGDKSKGKRSLGYFSVLICFEDTVSPLVRKFVTRGAQFLVNITNDAWFGNSKAPYLHVQGSVFQAVANRTPIVRAANTGISCFIDQFGRIFHPVEDLHKRKTYIAGFSVGYLTLSSGESFYTKFGDIFTYLCFSCILLAALIYKKGKKSKLLRDTLR